jgi:hypothetical protein
MLQGCKTLLPLRIVMLWVWSKLFLHVIYWRARGRAEKSIKVQNQ